MGESFWNLFFFLYTEILVFLISSFKLFSALWLHRNGGCYHLLCIGLSYRPAAPWHPQGGHHICTHCAPVVAVCCPSRHLQYHQVEPKNLPGSFALLHLQVLQEHGKRWMDLPWRNFSMYYWWLAVKIYWHLVHSALLFLDLCRCFFSFPGTEAMFADLGQFTATSMRVCWVNAISRWLMLFSFSHITGLS